MRGYILRAVGSSRHFFQSLAPQATEPNYVEDRDHAWFTTDVTAASFMVRALASKDIEVDIVTHSHQII